jgi:DNA polymerase-1
MSAAAMNGCMYLLDAHSLIFQVFHAIPEMSSPTGMPTNALFGFLRDLLTIRLEKKPDYLVCAFDLPGPTFRDGFFPEYKAHRKPMPDDLSLQMPVIHDLVEAMGIPLLSAPTFEADDIVATVATAASAKGIRVSICTTDKDCRQLIDDRVSLLNLRKGAVLDREALLKDWGVTPEQVVDLQSLVGDAVDNVPGIPGIGLKTAAKLLQDFGSVDNLLQNIDKVAGAKKQESLRSGKEKLELSRRLVQLSRDVPIKLDWEGWRLRPWDGPRLLEICKQCGFRTLAEQIRRADPEISGKPSISEVAPRQKELFPAASDPVETVPPPLPATKLPHKYTLVDTAAKFASFLKKLTSKKRFAIDLETTGLEPVHAELVGMSFSWSEGEAWYLAFRAPEGEPTLELEPTLGALRPILQDPAVAKINQNIKYDLLAMRGQGIQLEGIAGDSMVADYLLHAGERSHSIADLANRYLHHQVIPITDLIGKRGKQQLRLDQVTASNVAEYSGEDADIAWRLAGHLEPQLKQEGLKELYDTLEIPLIEVLAELEYNGIRVDLTRLKELGQEMALQLQALEKDIHQFAGRAFNIASPQQLRQVLFDELKLPAQRKTGVTGEASTDQETLERLAALGHPLPQTIINYRQIAKLKGTYVDALPDLVNKSTGRIHASFNQTVAATGRLSSSDPNLQNIPVRREQGRQIRQAFLPADGWVLLTADYSQIELRLLAHFSGDKELRRAFAENRDVHALVAGQIFRVPEAEVTEDMRRMAKTVNFGVIYGMSAHGLAQRLRIPRDEAGKFIDAYFARYASVLNYQSALLSQCRERRYVGTILGRRREISGVRPDSTYQQRNQPEREAINMEIQGSAADLIKLAMLKIHRRLRDERRRSRMLLQIHDELVFEAPPEELRETAALVREEMTSSVEAALKLQAPLRVDLSAGPNWLDVESLDGD